jgi:hypothetical protein
MGGEKKRSRGVQQERSRLTSIKRALLATTLGLLAGAPALGNPRLAEAEAGQLAVCAVRQGSGIKVKRENVLWGSVRKCRSPAEVDMKKALAATPEAKKIKDRGIAKGSAKYLILMAKANKRVRRIVKEVAVNDSRDCVVKKDSIKANPKKLTVVDLTDKVVEAIENE